MKRPIAWVLSALLSASMACATLTGGESDPNRPTPGGNSVPTDMAEPSPADDATNPPAATPESGGDTPAATGDTSPSDPHPFAAGPLRIASWELQINSSATGADARALLEGAGGSQFDPIEGNEYVVVNLTATNTGAADDTGAIFSSDLVLVDRTGIGRASTSLATLEPIFDALEVRGGESVSGHVVYEMPAGSGPYVLAFSTYNEEFLLEWGFLSTVEGAAVSEVTFPEGIQENEVGANRDQPAGLTEQVVTANWALTVEEVIRGEEAAQIIAGGNSFNPTPGEGREYLLARIRMVSGSLGPITYMSSINFTVEEEDGTVTGAPFIFLADRPGIDVFMVTGVEYTGWLVLDVPAGGDPLVVFDGSDSYANIAPRYFRLAP